MYVDVLMSGLNLEIEGDCTTEEIYITYIKKVGYYYAHS